MFILYVVNFMFVCLFFCFFKKKGLSKGNKLNGRVTIRLFISVQTIKAAFMMVFGLNY